MAVPVAFCDSVANNYAATDGSAVTIANTSPDHRANTRCGDSYADSSVRRANANSGGNRRTDPNCYSHSSAGADRLCNHDSDSNSDGDTVTFNKPNADRAAFGNPHAFRDASAFAGPFTDCDDRSVSDIFSNADTGVHADSDPDKFTDAVSNGGDDTDALAESDLVSAADAISVTNPHSDPGFDANARADANSMDLSVADTGAVADRVTNCDSDAGADRRADSRRRGNADAFAD